jgi:DNA processing protein
LYERVAAEGLLLTEFPPGDRPNAGSFPRRNRLISGLADASVVVEAAPGSGALITARWALEQGRGCFVVPGSIDAPASAGCLALLRAYPGEVRVVTGIAELLDDLELVEPDGAGGPAAGAGPSRAAVLALLGRSERAVAGALTDGATSVDELAERTGLAVPSVLGTLTLLEIRGLVVAAYGRYRAAGVLAGAPPGLP